MFLMVTLQPMHSTPSPFGHLLRNCLSGSGAGDISYVWTAQGWLYLAVILDLHSRRVIGFLSAIASNRLSDNGAVSDRMKKDMAIQALDMAVKLRNPPHAC